MVEKVKEDERAKAEAIPSHAGVHSLAPSLGTSVSDIHVNTTNYIAKLSTYNACNILK